MDIKFMDENQIFISPGGLRTGKNDDTTSPEEIFTRKSKRQQKEIGLSSQENMAREDHRIENDNPVYHDAAEFLPASERAPGIRVLKILRRAGKNVLYTGFDESLVDGPDQDSGIANCLVQREAMARDQMPMHERFVYWKEVDIQLEASRHQNILSLYRAVEDIDSSTRVLENFSTVSLLEALASHQGGDNFTKKIFLQIVSAVEFCHARGIYHRDLNLRNIMIKDSHVKLTNFKSATRDATSEDPYGIQSYMSPECFELVEKKMQIPYKSAPTDIWSLGILLVHLTTKKTPWDKPSVQDGQYNMYTSYRGIQKVSKELVSILIDGILNRDPNLRYGITKLGTSIANCSKLYQPIPPVAMAPVHQEISLDDLDDLDDPDDFEDVPDENSAEAEQ